MCLVLISLLELSDFDPDVVHSLLESPLTTLPHLTHGLKATMTELLSNKQDNIVSILFPCVLQLQKL